MNLTLPRRSIRGHFRFCAGGGGHIQVGRASTQTGGDQQGLRMRDHALRDPLVCSLRRLTHRPMTINNEFEASLRQRIEHICDGNHNPV